MVNYIKEKYPMVKAAVATCWEEGPKAYWNANNSWYTLLDGGPWNPWIPSRKNIHCPASDENDDIGIVAIPHLSRDLMAVFDGPGSYYGTHPQNILRGMVYEDRELPYFYNIVDQYRSMSRYNQGYSYNMMFVGPGWMSKGGRWEVDYDFLLKSYKTGMAYYGELKHQGKLQDLTMSEFADVYRQGRAYSRPECTLWKDILYGSKRQMFWFVDPWMRFCLDMNQGGAMIDLRPYAAKLERPVGCGHQSPAGCLLSLSGGSPYTVRVISPTTPVKELVKSCKVTHEGEEVDLCTCRTQASFSEEEGMRLITLDPVTIEFAHFSIRLQTIFRLVEGTGEIEIIRKVLESSDEQAEILIDEYLTACYGTTEYPEDMSGIRLSLKTAQQTETIEYAYSCRESQLEQIKEVEALIPQVETRLSMRADGETRGYFREGFAFSPMFTMGIRKQIIGRGELHSWLKVSKAG